MGLVVGKIRVQDLEDRYRCCAGIDVHKETVSVCVINRQPGKAAEGEVRIYLTTTASLVELSQWLKQEGVEQVVMESTGVYWKPVMQVLESEGIEATLANAQHVKNVPGRKTDTADSVWLATLLMKGLVKASFVPHGAVRELRDLCRGRAKLVEDRARVAERIQKLLEEANVKLASVATDVLGVSGWAMLKAMADEQTDPAQLAKLAKGRLKNKTAALTAALNGRWRAHQRFMLGELLTQVEGLDGQIARYQKRIDQVTAQHFQVQMDLLQTIPGVEQIAAAAILGEIGADMRQFPTAQNLSSWGGLCPGNNITGGKRRSGRTRKGNPWFRRVMNQAAWAASHTKDTYLRALFARLARRKRIKVALVALSHAMAQIIWHMLTQLVPYHELGPDFYDKANADQLRRYYVGRLRKLGFQVQLQPLEAAA